MRYVIGTLLGLLSGLLIYMIAALFLSSSPEGPTGVFVAVFFIGGWVLSTVAMVRNTRSTSKVVSRGALMGAAEWILVIPAGAVMAGRATSAVGGASDAELAGAAIGGGLFAMFTGALALGMAVVCLIVFTIAYFMGREMKPETAGATKKCPECAELVQPDAKKCRYCGTSFVDPSAGVVTHAGY
jgi:predicted RNA-binding Zn-ribbon protein involved in translation (DUF1610 family)